MNQKQLNDATAPRSVDQQQACSHVWHRLTELRPEHLQWIVLIYPPKGRGKGGKCEYIIERIYRYEKHKHFDVFRTKNGVDVILSSHHEADAVWCSLPSKPPYLPSWGKDEKWSENAFDVATKPAPDGFEKHE